MGRRNKDNNNVGGGPTSALTSATPRLPRVLTLAQRRRTGMVKQWSMDETKSWFYGRSSSLDRQGLQQEESGLPLRRGPQNKNGKVQTTPVKNAAEKKRKFFQRKNTSSAPTSSTESVDNVAAAAAFR